MDKRLAGKSWQKDSYGRKDGQKTNGFHNFHQGEEGGWEVPKLNYELFNYFCSCTKIL